ncbi:MAG: spore cortex biosynthesis protein YabQ [Lachnospiraceae bacterium]|nr:spore cortex biosynthesis protein YabQ [Lachnospiraceae bacterium]
MLSAGMMAELEYVLAMLVYGFLAAVCYQPLLFLRALVPHAKAVVDAEDILFFLAAGFLFFLTAYEKNDGILRWYAFAGAGLGLFLYMRTFGKTLGSVQKWLLQKRKKTATIKTQFISKGQVSVDEGSSPEHKSKRKKKQRD